MSLKSLILDNIKWLIEGLNPSEARKTNGRIPNDVVPAEEYNWFKNQFYKFLSTITNALRNSFSAVLNAYYGNTKLGDDMQDETAWTSISGTQSADTTNVKIGGFSLKLLENDNIASTISSNKDNITLDLSVLNNGEISADDDYINLVFFVSDVAKLNIASGITVQLGADATFNSANRKLYQITSGIVSGWNYFKIPKSAFTTSGGGTWSAIQSIRLTWASLINAQNEYVSFQLIQLVKKDPALPIPNPFQQSGVNDFEINAGEWFVGMEFGQITIKEIEELTAFGAITSNKEYDDFLISSTLIVRNAATTSWTMAYIDPDNYLSIRIENDELELRSNVATVIDEESKSFPIEVGDKLTFTLEKNGSDVIANVTKDGINFTTLSVTTTLSGLKLAVSPVINTVTKLDSLSITEIAYAAKSGTAEVAKSIAIKEQNGAFISEELNYGTFGLDKSNNRLYMKYSDTQVIYFQGTVV